MLNQLFSFSLAGIFKHWYICSNKLNQTGAFQKWNYFKRIFHLHSKKWRQIVIWLTYLITETIWRTWCISPSFVIFLFNRNSNLSISLKITCIKCHNFSQILEISLWKRYEERWNFLLFVFCNNPVVSAIFAIYQKLRDSPLGGD